MALSDCWGRFGKGKFGKFRFGFRGDVCDPLQFNISTTPNNVEISTVCGMSDSFDATESANEAVQFIISSNVKPSGDIKVEMATQISMMTPLTRK